MLIEFCYILVYAYARELIINWCNHEFAGEYNKVCETLPTISTMRVSRIFFTLWILLIRLGWNLLSQRDKFYDWICRNGWTNISGSNLKPIYDQWVLFSIYTKREKKSKEITRKRVKDVKNERRICWGEEGRECTTENLCVCFYGSSFLRWTRYSNLLLFAQDKFTGINCLDFSVKNKGSK